MKCMMKLAGCFLAFIILAACGLQCESVELPQTVKEPTATEPHIPEITYTPTEIPTPAITETPSKTATPTQPKSDVCFLSLPITYVNPFEDPPVVVLLDPYNADKLHQISAVGLRAGMVSAVTQNGFFFIDEDLEQMQFLDLDGNVEVLDFLNPDGGPFQGVVLPSPDGERVAHSFVTYDDDGGGHVKILVFNVDGSDEIVVLEKYVESRPARPTPIKWSADSQYLYAMNVIEGVGAYGGLDLNRIEIQTGISETIFPDLDYLSTISVSLDERYAARILRGETLKLVIKALETGDEMTLLLPSEYYQAGEMVWAPDSSAVLISVWGHEGDVDTFSVLYVDLVEQEVNVLFPDEGRFLRPVAWQVMDVIWLNDNEGNLWRMEADNLQMTLIAQEAWIIPRSR